MPRKYQTFMPIHSDLSFFVFTKADALLVVVDRALRNRTVLIVSVERVTKFRILFSVDRTAVGNGRVGIGGILNKTIKEVFGSSSFHICFTYNPLR